ncbi:hypothetical protein T440DRAFT_473773 [Plenodomus tracheiphilus IPT5]|uniref:Uncharacterized protein n=1 Tax=Plenodomus tracheiphilus IPT5 TaxID=1408161 RepID=A0A6A7ALL0_9PLEO|nr:hypothetical protein T440DRAFT_473773 [Plenodomus tracheiphilus IPT5]
MHQKHSLVEEPPPPPALQYLAPPQLLPLPPNDQSDPSDNAAALHEPKPHEAPPTLSYALLLLLPALLAIPLSASAAFPSL